MTIRTLNAFFEEGIRGNYGIELSDFSGRAITLEDMSRLIEFCKDRGFDLGKLNIYASYDSEIKIVLCKE